MSKETVKITVDGVEVEGIVLHRSKTDFGVIITSPFKNLSRGSHIPCFARAMMSFEGEYGDTRIAETLEGIYRFGKFLDDNMESLKEKLKQCEKKADDFAATMIDDDEFKNRRIALRKRLRSGELTNVEYQKLLTPLKKEVSNRDSEIHSIIREFYDENFPMCVPVGTEPQISAILNGEIEIK